MTAEQARAEAKAWIDGQYDRIITYIKRCAEIGLMQAVTNDKLTDETRIKLEADGYKIGEGMYYGESYISWEPPKTISVHVEGNPVPIAYYVEGEVEADGGIAEVVKPRKSWFERLFS